MLITFNQRDIHSAAIRKLIHNICNLVFMLTKHFSVNLLDVHTKLLFLVPVSGRAFDGN